MALWPLALIGLLAGLVFLLDASVPTALAAEGADARLIYLGLLLAFLVFFGARFRRSRLRPALLMIAAWIGIFAALVTAYAYREEAEAVFDRVRGEISPTMAVTRGDGVVELRKTLDGHFRASTGVNGETVPMLVDTGASLVVLSYDDAASIGLAPERLAFTTPVQTANGRAYVAPVTLERLAIGAIELGQVRAAVAEEGKLGSSLLGMSFLGRLSETSFRGDRLVLRE